VLFEREELLDVFDLDWDLEFDDLDFDEVPRFEPPVDPLLLERELDFLLAAILSSSGWLVVAHLIAHPAHLGGELTDAIARLADLDSGFPERLCAGA
jgi:hypothetical protein